MADVKEKNDFKQVKEELLFNKLKQLDQNAEIGLPTGFMDLDAITQGLKKSELIVIGSRPSMGKTSLLLNIASFVSKKHKNVVFFSLDMTSERIIERLLSLNSLVKQNNIMASALSAKDWDNLYIAIQELSDSNMLINDSCISVNEIYEKSRALESKSKVDLILIDDFQLMFLDEKLENRHQELSKILRILKKLAKEINCPIIITSQVSRNVEIRADHRPILQDLKESGALEEYADTVIFLYMDEYYYPDCTEKPNIMELIIAKNKTGRTGIIELKFLKKYSKITNVFKEE